MLDDELVPTADPTGAETGTDPGDADRPAPKKRTRKTAKKAAAPVPDVDGPAAEASTAPGEAPGEALDEAPAPARKKARSRRKAAEPVPGDAETGAAAPASEGPASEGLASDGLASDGSASDEPAPKTTPKTTPKITGSRRSRKKADAPTAEPNASEMSSETSSETSSGDPGSTLPATVPLFKAPEPTQDEPAAEETAPRARRTRKKKAEAAPTEEPADEGAAPADDAEERALEDAEDPGDTDDSDEGGPGSRRRRRRGGRRRRKGASGTGDDDAEGAEGADDDSADTASGGDAESGESTSSRRRRRRRRAGDDGGEGSDEPEKTTTRVRRGRSAEDEITAVSGSTRLEAKKQRRREGREAGRRRAPIVSEAEFLARRESVDRVMAVRQREDVTQIAVLEDKVLVEHYVARESQTSLIGNVYLGRVQNVLPSMEAAFVDIGKGRNAVLYAGEVNWSALGHKDGQPRKIESVLSSGQAVLVQVTKDPVGHKGARLTSQISLAGRFLVYVPDGTTSGISRKLPDTERSRLKTLLKDIVPDTAGVIVRTAAEGAAEDELTRDVERLKARWEDIEKKVAKGNSPQLLYGEPDLTLKVVRDLFTEDFSRLVVQGDDAWDTVREYVGHMAPDLEERLERYDTSEHQDVDLFASLRIDEQIHKGLDRKVWLPSGGSLVIDRTEAMTVVDVNTGKFTGSGGNLEETVTKNNLEAAEEIVRQLRLRDIGGIIVVDFIDMVLESNRDLVLRRLVECLGRDRTRHQVAEVTSLGLVQMTRKRIGTGLLEAFSETCEHCGGRGLLIQDAPVEPRRADDSSPRGAGRRSRSARGRSEGGSGNGNGNGNGNGVKPPVPSPRDVAAMAREHADKHPSDGDDAEAAADGSAAPDTDLNDSDLSDSGLGDSGLGDTGTSAASAAELDTLPDAADADDVGEVEDLEPLRSAAASPDDSDREPKASEDEAAAASPAPATTTVVTRTRRRAASRPAGPPTAESAPAQAGAAASDGHGQGGAGDVLDDAPHVEHVPIKKKGARKR